MINSDWERNGVNGDLPSFLKELANVRRHDLAYDWDEHANGISAIGFAFNDWDGGMHAISAPVPSTRFESMGDLVEGPRRDTAANIERTFSYLFSPGI
ncbi:IclR family transcriptional regulator C-terminal domain-containing protein, partial [Epibacterium ulvae]|uniref:IclR family transcriptional regulator C-terminal domain-containing protein n=1 Tax=Epibacterium ulvae TaxID=1156985 RepID=UPI001BFC4B6D